MARVAASVYTSHVPAIGAALDQGKTGEPYWQPLFAGYEPSQRWMRDHVPDVVFLVFNDHATAFSLEMIPTFAIGLAPTFAVADEGWGRRPVPDVVGHPELAGHIAQARATWADSSRFDRERILALVGAAGFELVASHGVGAVADHVAEAVLDSESGAHAELLALDGEVATDPAFQALAPHLHVFASRP